MVGSNEAVAEPVSWGLGGAALMRRARTQVKWRPNQSEVESVMFGCDDLDQAKITIEVAANRIG